ncbi:MAG TPA: hypothetical protein VID67_14220 [Rhizomicrobium sp.]
MGDQSDDKKQRPRLRVKKKGGAPQGNRNALKSGYYTKPKLEERRKFHAEVRELILRIMATVARANLVTVNQKPKVTVTRIDLTPSPHRPSN